MNTFEKSKPFATAFQQTEKWNDLQTLIKNKKTPFLAIFLNEVKNRFLHLKENFKSFDFYYSVKANPQEKIIRLLGGLNSHFEVASLNELKLCLKNHSSKQTKFIFSNTLKKASDIKSAYKLGVRTFVCDCDEDLQKLVQFAPKSNIYFRLINDGKGAEWPLSKKFGTTTKNILRLAELCVKKKLTPYGLSFHVGSQQKKISSWLKSIEQTHTIYKKLAKKNIFLKAMNLGGGLPSHYLTPSPSLEALSKAILPVLKKKYNGTNMRFLIEPGRYLVGSSGVIVSEVISKRTLSKKRPTWLYLDIGVFNGLIETLGEAIKYPIWTNENGCANTKPYVLAGPTCDSADIMYQHFLYHLPSNLSAGNKVYFFSAGAYTYPYSSICFNGFLPLPCYVL